MQPKGSIVVECGNALLKNGYKVRILNTINFKKSMHYNPFAYVHSEKDILKLVTTLMTNTKGEGSGGDPFWEKSERLLLTALIAYLHYEAPVEEQNFATLLEMLNTMQVLEDDEEYQNPVDLLFEELAKKKPNSFAGRQYKLYKLAAGKTAKSILISCGARLAPFDIQELRDLTMYDELQLDTLGDKKTALFLIMSDTDSTFNFLISMVYTQLFNLLCDKADDVYGGKLPIHVRCLIDECANIGQIPQLEKLVATIRSREISACLVLQARSQLKAIYKDNADTIVGNMDSQIFLGGSEPTTLKDLSEMLGKETIDAFNTSDTRGNSPSYGTTLSICQFVCPIAAISHFGELSFFCQSIQDSTCSGRRNIEKILYIDVLDNMVCAEKCCNFRPTHFFLALCNRLFIDCFGQSLFDDSQHKFDKNSSFTLCIRLIDCCVILGLMVVNDGFDGKPCE